MPHTFDENEDHTGWGFKRLFDSIDFDKIGIPKRKAKTTDNLRGPRDEEDDDKVQSKLRQMVAAMITAAPTLREDQAMHFILHMPHGRKMFEHFTKTEKDEPQMNRSEELLSLATDFGVIKLCKKISDDVDAHSLTSDELTTMGMEDARKQYPTETPAKAFAKYYDVNLEFRKAIAIAHDQQTAAALVKGYATLKPTSTEVGNTNVTDDSAEAVRLLSEMATKNGRSFEKEFADPTNAKLANATYTNAHRAQVR
jgi:hypothetical protein